MSFFSFSLFDFLGATFAPFWRHLSIKQNSKSSDRPTRKFANLHRYEPGAVRGKSFRQWAATTLEECAGDPEDRECWPGPGDRVDHQWVGGQASHVVSHILNRPTYYDLFKTYFCGNDSPPCLEASSSKAGLARAKENVDRFYPVVGILEM